MVNFSYWGTVFSSWNSTSYIKQNAQWKSNNINCDRFDLTRIILLSVTGERRPCFSASVFSSKERLRSMPLTHYSSAWLKSGSLYWPSGRVLSAVLQAGCPLASWYPVSATNDISGQPPPSAATEDSVKWWLLTFSETWRYGQLCLLFTELSCHWLPVQVYISAIAIMWSLDHGGLFIKEITNLQKYDKIFKWPSNCISSQLFKTVTLILYFKNDLVE